MTDSDDRGDNKAAHGLEGASASAPSSGEYVLVSRLRAAYDTAMETRNLLQKEMKDHDRYTPTDPLYAAFSAYDAIAAVLDTALQGNDVHPAPQVPAVISPAAGAVITDPHQKVAGTAVVGSVLIFDNGEQQTSLGLNGPDAVAYWSWAPESGWPKGGHTVKVQAFRGNETHPFGEASVTFTVQ